MIQPVTKTLAQQATDRLSHLQGKVDAKPSFAKKVAEAQRLWRNKNSSNPDKRAFGEIKNALHSSHVLGDICHYCEQNENNDIEHINPKSFFPQYTFDWENYLLVCKQCNSGYKLDKCFVLNDNNDLCKVDRGIELQYKTIAFINPRLENPNDFLIMNMKTFEFEIHPGIRQNKAKRNKAIKTLEILQLNNRDLLIEQRESAAKYFYQRFEQLVNILESDTLAEVEDKLTPYDKFIDKTLPLSDIKLRIKAGIKKDIQSHQHPSVWHAIKMVERATNPKWKTLFDRLQEALDW